ncbi:MAG: hypothetical protein M3Q39_04440 [Actinomycetota bacterium]|nr:hypothetical protein [Actinomycetota bacterium]
MTNPVRGGLTSTGWIDWAGVRAQLGEDECLWVDLGGVHHGSAPAHRPVGATHLWSWRPDRWARVRFDGDRALATLLTAGVAAPGEPITIRTAEGLPWERYSRAAEWDHKLTLVVTEGTAPITFVQIP